jgi:hypothetical protein
MLKSCACDVFSEMWVALNSGYAMSKASTKAKVQIEMLMDQLSSRQVQLEMLDKKCIAEARRHRASGARTQFRGKMLEHRRLQDQLVKLQRYRETALAQLDAVSNHEINQTFLRAIQGSGLGAIDTKETEKSMEELQDAVKKVRDISDILGQPLADDADDDDLDLEFMEFSTGETTTEPPEVTAPLLPAVPHHPRPQPVTLRTDALFG